MSPALSHQTGETRNRNRPGKSPICFRARGNWSEEDYLALNGNQLVEFSQGFLEVLPMPTTSHQLLVVYLYGLLWQYIIGRDLGTVLVAPLRVRLGRGKFREPDIVFMLKEHAGRIGEDFWTGTDLVMEVVNGEDEDRSRDLVTKRREYARAGIGEYWIVDPQEERITRPAARRQAVCCPGDFCKGTWPPPTCCKVSAWMSAKRFPSECGEALRRRLAERQGDHRHNEENGKEREMPLGGGTSLPRTHVRRP